MSPESADSRAVARGLQSYADRGVFRGFARRPAAGGRDEYRFLWLTESPIVLRFDPRSRTLALPDLLPNVAYPSAMDRALRAFLAQRSSADLPPHRRIDPKRVEVRCRNRAGNVTITLAVAKGHGAYATKKAISLVNEIFHGFLRGPYYEYMVENFNEPEE